MSRRKETYTIGDLRTVYPAPVHKKPKKYPEPPVGMNELAPILTQMARDIKVIRRTQDMPSAQRWASEMNTKHNTGYKANWEDLDGDKVPELVVRDTNRDNALITVNGYTTVPSTWVDTLKYGADLPYDKRREMRKKGEPYPNKAEWNKIFTGAKVSVDNPFELDISNVNDNRYDEFGGIQHLIDRGYKIKNYDKTKTYKQTAYQAFNKFVFQPVFNGIKEALSLKAKDKGYTDFARDWAFVFPSVGSITKACAISYNQLVIVPVTQRICGDEAEEVLNDETLLKKLKTKGAFKQGTKTEVLAIIDAVKNETAQGTAEKTALLIDFIYSNNPMLAKVGLLNKDSQDYNDVIDYIIGYIKNEYANLIKEKQYQLQFGSPVRPQRNPNEVADQMQDDRDFQQQVPVEDRE